MSEGDDIDGHAGQEETSNVPSRGRWQTKSRFRSGFISRLKPLLPYGLIPLAVFVNFHRALSFHFWPDDWHMVGPPVAREFLAHPFGVFTSLQVFHYAPLAKVWYALQSVLFRDNPFPYHLLNLVLLSVAAILLYRLLLVYRISPLPALAGAVYYGFSVVNNHQVGWIVGANYYLLSIPFIIALMKWESYIHDGRKRDLVLTVAMVATSQLIHSLGAILPLLLLLRYHLAPRNERGLPPGRAWRAAGLMFALVLVLYLLPRLAFSLDAQPVPPLDLPRLAKALWYCLARQIVPSLWGNYSQILSSLRPPTVWILMVVSAFLFAAWLVRPRQWRVFLLGVAIAVLGWIPAQVLLGWAPEDYCLRGRYMIIPNLGVGLCLAAVVSGALSDLGRWTRPALALGVALFAGLFLFQNLSATRLLHGQLWGIQDRWIDQAAERYRADARQAAASSSCGRVVVVDTELKKAWPLLAVGGNPLLIQRLDHATFHRFYFADDDEMLRRFIFVKDQDEASRSGVGRECVLMAFGGRLSASGR